MSYRRHYNRGCRGRPFLCFSVCTSACVCCEVVLCYTSHFSMHVWNTVSLECHQTCWTPGTEQRIRSPRAASVFSPKTSLKYSWKKKTEHEGVINKSTTSDFWCGCACIFLFFRNKAHALLWEGHLHKWDIDKRWLCFMTDPKTSEQRCFFLCFVFVFNWKTFQFLTIYSGKNHGFSFLYFIYLLIIRSLPQCVFLLSSSPHLSWSRFLSLILPKVSSS